jgi:dolichol-phosphate mannosyltransferase
MSVAVAVPAYKCKKTILSVIEAIPSFVEHIFIVDDSCPQNTGLYVTENVKDARVSVIFHAVNQGVGGATLSGFRAAHAAGARVVVKLDGDGQMDPELIADFVDPILAGESDFTKGNRFFYAGVVSKMPFVRLVGNAGLSLLAKLMTGYWNLMDPTNGFLALSCVVLDKLETERLEKRYFFEQDLLYRLGLMRARCIDVPMAATYGDEESSLSISHSLLTFPPKIVSRTFKRIVYSYFIRDFNLGSVFLTSGILATVFGLVAGIFGWYQSSHSGVFASAGAVMVAAIPFSLGVQFLLAWAQFEVTNVPRDAISKYLWQRRVRVRSETKMTHIGSP